jgi:hypothetical protein
MLRDAQHPGEPETGSKTARELAVAYFEPSLLKGAGILMAENEILSHCELLQACGDVAASNDGGFQATGTWTFESAIDALDPTTADSRC